MGLYVYGVTRASAVLPADLRGVGDPPTQLRTVPAGPLAAVVGPVPGKLRARRRDVQAHQDVLMGLLAHAPVLPARFGVVAADEESVCAPLECDAGAYLAALDRIADRVEMNLKVEVVEEGLADLMREDEEVRRLRAEHRRRPGYDVAIRLGEAVVAGLRRRAAAAAEELMSRLVEMADESRPGPEVAGCVANVSFLVGTDHVAAMRGLVGRFEVQAGSRAAVRLTGPLPCYSFSELPAVSAV
jgi:hypothetical protein